MFYVGMGVILKKLITKLVFRQIHVLCVKNDTQFIRFEVLKMNTKFIHFLVEKSKNCQSKIYKMCKHELSDQK